MSSVSVSINWRQPRFLIPLPPRSLAVSDSNIPPRATLCQSIVVDGCSVVCSAQGQLGDYWSVFLYWGVIWKLDNVLLCMCHWLGRLVVCPSTLNIWWTAAEERTGRERRRDINLMTRISSGISLCGGNKYLIREWKTFVHPRLLSRGILYAYVGIGSSSRVGLVGRDYQLLVCSLSVYTYIRPYLEIERNRRWTSSSSIRNRITREREKESELVVKEVFYWFFFLSTSPKIHPIHSASPIL